MEFIPQNPMILAGMEDKVARKEGAKDSLVVRFNDVATGKQMELMAFDDPIIKQIKGIKPYTPVSLVLSIVQQGYDNKLYLRSVVPVKA